MTDTQRLSELADVLRTLLAERFRGHTVADRLQFSPAGRELLRRADAALPSGPEGLTTVSVSTRQPESYELLNLRDGTRWVIRRSQWAAADSIQSHA